MYKKVVYVVNEVKGVTYDIPNKEGGLSMLKNDLDKMVVRDPNKNTKPFTKVALEQDKTATAAIITLNSRYDTVQLYTKDEERQFYAKTNTEINIARNLYNRGITFAIINYKYINNELRYERVVVKPEDNLYTKLDELYHTEKRKVAIGHLDRNGKIIDDNKRTIEIKPVVNYQIMKVIQPSIDKGKNGKQRVEHMLDLFRRYATIYGLDATNPSDYYTFEFFIQHPECADVFLDGTKFRCPKCGNVVHVNGHEEYINGKPVNTFETVCDYCGEEFDIHDKQDILDMLANRSK